MFSSKLLTIGAVLVPVSITLWLQHQSATLLKADNSELRQSVKALAQELREGTSGQDGREASLVRPSIEYTDKLSSSAENRPTASVSSVPKRNPSDAQTNSVDGVSHVSLKKTDLKQLRLKPFTDSFELTEQAAAVLGLTDSELTSVNRTLAQLIEKHHQLDISHSRQVEEHLNSEEGRKTTFKVSAYPEAGRRLEEETFAALRQTLGETRFRLMLHYADLPSLNNDGFNPFGYTEKTITFVDKTNADGTRGECKIYMRVVDTRSGFAVVSGFANNNDSIPKNWRHLIQNIYPVQ